MASATQEQCTRMVTVSREQCMMCRWNGTTVAGKWRQERIWPSDVCSRGGEEQGETGDVLPCPAPSACQRKWHWQVNWEYHATLSHLPAWFSWFKYPAEGFVWAPSVEKTNFPPLYRLCGFSCRGHDEYTHTLTCHVHKKIFLPNDSDGLRSKNNCKPSKFACEMW